MVRGLAGGQQDTLQRLKTLIDLAERDLDGIQAFLEADMVGAEIANVVADVVEPNIHVVDAGVHIVDAGVHATDLH